MIVKSLQATLALQVHASRILPLCPAPVGAALAGTGEMKNPPWADLAGCPVDRDRGRTVSRCRADPPRRVARNMP